MKQVAFVSRDAAEHIVPDKDNNGAIISINSDNDLAKLHKAWKHKLFLVFHDLDKFYEGYTLFNEEHAKQIIAFLEEVKDVHTVVVHCDAGVSRSSAVSKFIAERYGLYFDENYSIYNKFVFSILKWVDSGEVIPIEDKPSFTLLKEKVKVMKDKKYQIDVF